MIQIYTASNTDYTHNGDTVLAPVECEVSAELNGTWELTMEHPLDEEERWKLIQEGAVLSAPTFNKKEQLYRIYRKIKEDTGVTAYARPIFLDAMNDCILLDVRPTNATGQQALNAMMAGTPYSGTSDITKLSTAYYVKKNLIEAINGKIDQSFINRWGGEILYDNYQIQINQRAGTDRGLQVRYGRNLEAITEDINREEIITRIIPVAFNGYTLEGEEPWVDSPLIDQYPVIYVKVVEFKDVKLTADASGSDEETYDTMQELRAALVQKAEDMYAVGCDKPEVSLKINMVDLSRLDEYKDYKGLEQVYLGDTVHCHHEKLGITSEARVTKLKWDCIRNTPGQITLGAQIKDYFDQVSSVIKNVNNIITPSGAVSAEKVSGILNAMQTQLRYQKDVANKQDVRAILFEDLDPKSPTYGAMCLGTQGFQIASERLADGSDWKWTTFGTSKGFVADYIIGGTLISQNYEEGKQGFKMNLNTGEADIPVLEIATGDLRIQITELQGDVGGLQNNVGDIQTNIEDLNTDVGNLQGDVDGINQDIDGLEQTTTQKFAQIDASVDSITQTVASVSQASAAQSEAISQLQISADNITQVVRQAIIDAGVPDLAERVAKVELEADSLSIQLTEVQKYGDTVNQVNRFFDFLQSGLKTGMDGSPFYTLLSETELGFYENGTRVAYISNNRLYINSAWVRGDFVLENVAAQKFVKQYVNSDGYFCVQAASSAG